MTSINGIEHLSILTRVNEIQNRIAEIEDAVGVGKIFQATLDREIARQAKVQNTDNLTKVQPLKDFLATHNLQPVNENEAANAAKIAQALKALESNAVTNPVENLPGAESLNLIGQSPESIVKGVYRENFAVEDFYDEDYWYDDYLDEELFYDELWEDEFWYDDYYSTPARYENYYVDHYTDDTTEDYIKAAARRHGVDADLVRAVATAESNLNQAAVSEVGAIGVMQLMPETAASLGVNPYDERQNIDGGAQYLRQMLDKFDGNLQKAIAAYNAGPGAVQKYGGVPPYSETQNYVGRVLDFYSN